MLPEFAKFLDFGFVEDRDILVQGLQHRTLRTGSRGP